MNGEVDSGKKVLEKKILVELKCKQQLDSGAQ